MTQTPSHDVAVVLGAAVKPGGQASESLIRRVAHGVGLYQAGRVPHLLMAGGVGRHPPAEAYLMRGLALAAGVPEAAIVVETYSRDTLENAAFSRDILNRNGWRRVLVVTDAYHLPRALYTFRRLGIDADGSAVPVPRLLLSTRCRETAAFLIYLWRVERHRRGG
ncbi:MAG TPA: YdcF family protein [Patescibacteria group bacterium]|nr:YdcF family protein [Patescibacteria group bacterium]